MTLRVDQVMRDPLLLSNADLAEFQDVHCENLENYDGKPFDPVPADEALSTVSWFDAVYGR